MNKAIKIIFIMFGVAAAIIGCTLLGMILYFGWLSTKVSM